jgi:hypothetical protein
MILCIPACAYSLWYATHLYVYSLLRHITSLCTLSYHHCSLYSVPSHCYHLVVSHSCHHHTVAATVRRGVAERDFSAQWSSLCLVWSHMVLPISSRSFCTFALPAVSCASMSRPSGRHPLWGSEPRILSVGGARSFGLAPIFHIHRIIALHDTDYILLAHHSTLTRLGL